MNLYLEASAAVKRYIVEPGTPEVRVQIQAAQQVATSGITRVEVIATLARSVRGGRLAQETAEIARVTLQADCQLLLQLDPVNEILNRAEEAAWSFGLRGYDAVHLASATYWRDVLADEVVVATFDRQVWNACAPAGLIAWPPDLAAFGVTP